MRVCARVKQSLSEFKHPPSGGHLRQHAIPRDCRRLHRRLLNFVHPNVLVVVERLGRRRRQLLAVRHGKDAHAIARPPHTPHVDLAPEVAHRTGRRPARDGRDALHVLEPGEFRLVDDRGRFELGFRGLQHRLVDDPPLDEVAEALEKAFVVGAAEEPGFTGLVVQFKRHAAHRVFHARSYYYYY